MRRPANRRRARLAAALSVALHLIVVSALLPTLRTSPRPVAPPEPDYAIVLADPRPAKPLPPPPVPVATPIPPPKPAEPSGQPPTVAAVPSALPASVRELMKRRDESPELEIVQDVVDVRRAPVSESPKAATPTIQQASHVAQVAPRVAERPVAPPKTVAYVLDCSGTMGQRGKLGRARAAILAELDGFGPETKVVVVTYSGRAAPLLPGGPLPATDAARSRIRSALLALEPAGASRHVEGVRLALKFAPDAVTLVTDADDAELAEVQPVLRGAGRAVRFAVTRGE